MFCTIKVIIIMFIIKYYDIAITPSIYIACYDIERKLQEYTCNIEYAGRKIYYNNNIYIF